MVYPPPGGPGRTGQVTLRDFDVGMATTIGGELITIQLDGEEAQDYAVRVPGVTGPPKWNGAVPVFFSSPEDVYGAWVLPHIHIARSSATPAMNRWHPLGREYQIPAATAVEVVSSGGLRGPSLVERKPHAKPFDISYEIHMRARLRAQANALVQWVGQFMWAYGQVFVMDSIGEERGYYAFLDSLDSLDDLADVADRTIGFTMSLRVEGELDFVPPTVHPTSPGLSLDVVPRYSAEE